MQDRPDLIQSELAGLAFDSLQQVFRKPDIEIALNLECLPIPLDTTVWIVVDPAAGGPQSDYAVVSIVRSRGVVMVSRSRQHVRLLARLDELVHGHALVAEELRHDGQVQVLVEARELGSVALELHVRERLFRFRAHVEEEEEDCQQRRVRVLLRVSVQLLQLDRVSAAEINVADVLDAVAQQLRNVPVVVPEE